MPRGVRKSPVEKFEEELAETEELIKRHSGIVSDLKVKKKEIQENIRIEKLNEIYSLIEENKMSLDDVKAMIESTKK